MFNTNTSPRANPSKIEKHHECAEYAKQPEPDNCGSQGKCTSLRTKTIWSGESSEGMKARVVWLGRGWGRIVRIRGACRQS